MTDNRVKLVEADDMTAAELSNLPIEELRRLYRVYRKCWLYEFSRDVVDAAVAATNPVTPVDYILAIRSIRLKCDRCRGSGVYSWGACVNGKMTHSGYCYRCGGKGKMDSVDCRRGKAYDNHAIHDAFRQMCG